VSSSQRIKPRNPCDVKLRRFSHEGRLPKFATSDVPKVMKIFVSSTHEDLKRHRRAVRDAILRLGHHPVCMEDFGSRPDPWNIAALNAIADCGALVGIYAHRYGSTPSGSAVSITEQEFDRASHLHIPRFCYLVDPAYRWHRTLIDEGVQKERLARFLQKVNALLRTTFRTPDDLAAKIAADLGRELAKFVSAGTASRLHELPPPPRDFLGRSRELNSLEEIATKHPGQVVAIRGMGGIGKTAIGLVLAAQLAGRYPDAQFYMDLQGTAAGNANSADIMAHVIRGFYPGVPIPNRPDDLAGMYRSILADAKVLLFLDNVRRADQMADIIPSANSLVLFTSRWRFPFAGMSALDLGPMEEKEARALLLDIGPRIGADADTLAFLAGYVPLALCVLGRTLRERPDLSPRDLIGRLSDESNRLKFTDVADKLAASYQLLPAELQKSFPVLSLFSDGFTVPAAAAALRMDNQTAQMALGVLYSWSLVEWSEVSSRYRLHDLVRAFIKSKLSSDRVPHAAIIEYFTRYAMAHIAEHDALAAEEQNLVASVDDAIGLAAWSSVLQLGRSMKEFLRLQGKWTTLEAVLRNGLVASQRSADRGQEAWFRHELSHLLTSTGRYRQALRFANESLNISSRLHDGLGVARGTRQLGLVHRRTKHVDQAMKCYRKSLRSYRKLKSPDGEALCLHSIGSLYREMGKLPVAEQYYRQSLRIRRRLHDNTGIGATLFQLARILFDNARYQEARKLCDEVLTTTQDVVFRSRCQVLLGRILAAQGHKILGLELLQAGYDILTRIASPEAKAAKKYLTQLKNS
jgi:tetratricopeptide (TPR) repeat protein